MLLCQLALLVCFLPTEQVTTSPSLLMIIEKAGTVTPTQRFPLRYLLPSLKECWTQSRAEQKTEAWQHWISPVTWVRHAQMEKGRRKNCMGSIPFQFKQCFFWLTLLLTTTSYDIAIIHSQQSIVRPAWAGLLCCSPLFPGILLPKEADCLCREPPLLHPQVSHTSKGGGTPLPFIELVSIQIKIIRSYSLSCSRL